MTILQTIQTIRQLAGDSIFRATFTKRKDNSRRRMLCRLNCSTGVTGKGRAYSAEDKGLLSVYDVEKRGWRMIPIDSEDLRLKIRGQEYLVNQNNVILVAEETR